jgi:hypothetical protein
MKDAYTNVFYDAVRETQAATGYELPHSIEAYVVMLLANYVDRPDFLPEKSFAEAYYNLSKTSDAKSLGDCCLFITGVFSHFGQRKGIQKSYYAAIGVSSYETLSLYLNGELFGTLATHFDFISEFITEVTVPRVQCRVPFR